jgi:hypothetical protein
MPVTDNFRQAVYAAQTEKVFLILLKIEHADLPEPILVVHNGEDIVSNGETYQACAFGLVMPDDKDDAPPRATIQIDNVGTVTVDGEEVNLVHELRAVRGKPAVTVSIVLSDDPDTVEFGPLELQLVSIGFNILTIQGDLAYEDFLNARWPADDFTPQNFPGLFP